MLKWGFGILVALILGAAYYVFVILPANLDAGINTVLPHGPYDISVEAAALHATLRVADLHADTTLWARNPANRQSQGHVDLPRLQEGGVRLQVFSATTKSPSGQNYTQNTADSDRITQLVMIQRWPIRTWDSLYERAAYQAQRLQRLETQRSEHFTFVRSAAELETTLAEGKIAGLYLIEGGHPLEGDIDNLDRLYDEGLRIVGLQHFFDNELGGSLHGVSGAGLTAFGRAVVQRADDKSMIIDIAHSSEATVRDVLALSDRPLIVSHTGMKGHCNSPRNISDDLMKQIADAGGLIGIGFWPDVVCGVRPADIAAAILYAVEHLGVEHVALGSDFDGAVATPIDAANMVAITEALLAAGLDEASIRAVMGENAIRFFRDNLPASD